MRYLLRYNVDSCLVEHQFLEDDAVPDDDPYVIVIDDKVHHYVQDRLRLLKAIEGLADVLDPPPSDVPLFYQTIVTLLEAAFVLGRKYQRDNPKEEVEDPNFY